MDYREIESNRRMIDGCLNRLQVTSDIAEINQQASNLFWYLSQHIVLNKKRILDKERN